MKGKNTLVTTQREGGGAKLPQAVRVPRLRRVQQDSAVATAGPEDSTSEQVAETRKTGREKLAVARDGHAGMGAAAGGGGGDDGFATWWGGDGGGERRPRFATGGAVKENREGEKKRQKTPQLISPRLELWINRLCRFGSTKQLSGPV